jgi:hypothetical protein
MSHIEKALQKYIDRNSTDEEVLASAKIQLLSSIDELDGQFDKLATAIQNRMRPRMVIGDYEVAITKKVERAIAEQMELVRLARQLKVAPDVNVGPLYASLDRVERKCWELRSVNIEFCSKLTTTNV